MKKFVNIYYPETLQPFSKTLITDMLKEMLGFHILINEYTDYLHIEYDDTGEYDIADLANSLKADTLMEFTIFEAPLHASYEAYMPILACLKDHPRFLKEAYFNEKDILAAYKVSYPAEVKALVLKKYLNDYANLEVIKTFIEHNGNTSKTAKILFMHRNTIINKVDKFIQITGYDIRDFKDAYIIYNMIS